MKMRVLFFFLIFPFLCFAAESEFASLETDLEFIIDGKVNVISGAFIDVREDLVVPSLYPLSITRASIPTNSANNMWAGWHLNYCTSCFSSISHAECQHFVRDENGTFLVFEAPIEKKEVFSPLAKMCAKGETNLGRGAIGGKTVLRNYSVKMEKDEVVIKTGGGVRKIFSDRQPINKQMTIFSKSHGERTETPSGFSSRAFSTKPHTLTKVSYSADGKEMGKATLEVDDPEKTSFFFNSYAHLKSDDGREVEYMFKPLPTGRKLLTEIKYSPRHWVRYRYDGKDQEGCTRDYSLA